MKQCHLQQHGCHERSSYEVREKYRMVSFICGIQHKWTHVQNRNRLTHIRLGLPRGRGERKGTAWEFLVSWCKLLRLEWINNNNKGKYKIHQLKKKIPFDNLLFYETFKPFMDVEIIDTFKFLFWMQYLPCVFFLSTILFLYIYIYNILYIFIKFIYFNKILYILYIYNIYVIYI